MNFDLIAFRLVLAGTMILPFLANIGACLYLAALGPFVAARLRRPEWRAADPALWWMAGYTALALLEVPFKTFPLFDLYGLFTRFAFYFLVYALVRGCAALPDRQIRLCWALVVGGWATTWLGLWQYAGPWLCTFTPRQTFWSWMGFGGLINANLSCNQFSLQAIRLPYEQYPGMMPFYFVDLIMLPQFDGRSRSILMGPTIFGVWLVLLLPLLAQAPLAATRRWVRVLAWVNLAATLVVLILTFTRNAWVCGVAVLALYIALTRRWRLAAWLAGLGAGSAAVLAVAVPAIGKYMAERLVSIPSLTYESNAQRILMWKYTLAQIREHPWLGVSNYGFRLYLPDLWNMGWPHAHNQWLHNAVETGIPLTLFFTALTVWLAWRGLQRWRARDTGEELSGWQAAAWCGVVGFFLLGMVDYTAYEPRNYHVFWLLLALL